VLRSVAFRNRRCVRAVLAAGLATLILTATACSGGGGVPSGWEGVETGQTPEQVRAAVGKPTEVERVDPPIKVGNGPDFDAECWHYSGDAVACFAPENADGSGPVVAYLVASGPVASDLLKD
jgi:hypothetical protein